MRPAARLFWLIVSDTHLMGVAQTISLMLVLASMEGVVLASLLDLLDNSVIVLLNGHHECEVWYLDQKWARRF